MVTVLDDKGEIGQMPNNVLTEIEQWQVHEYVVNVWMQV